MPKQSLQDRVEPLGEDKIKEIVSDHWQHEKARKRIKAVIDEYVDSVPFMEKVQTYAGKEYDNRLLKSGRFWGSQIVPAVVTTLIVLGITKLLS